MFICKQHGFYELQEEFYTIWMFNRITFDVMDNRILLLSHAIKLSPWLISAVIWFENTGPNNFEVMVCYTWYMDRR